MKIMHLADLHLGFRQFERTTPSGVNQREADVADAFTRAIDITIAQAPDLVVIGGDVFHHAKPGNHAIIHACAEFGRLTRMLPNAIVVVAAGNHDLPRSADVGCILGLIAELGFRGARIRVAMGAPMRFDFPDRDCSVLAVPDAHGVSSTFEPNPAAGTNVLVTHLEVTDVFPLGGEVGRPGLRASIAELGPERWDYVAVGHYHVTRELAPNAWYSGSIAYTSTNPWGELLEEAAASLDGKRILEFDTETRECRYHRVVQSRALLDLPPIGAHGMSVRDLDDALQANAASASIDCAIVRQVVRDLSPSLKRELDYKAIRALQKRALNYQLDTRKQEIVRVRSGSVFTARKSLDELVAEAFAKRVIESDIPREALVARGLDYLAEATAQESRKPGGTLLELDAPESVSAALEAPANTPNGGLTSEVAA